MNSLNEDLSFIGMIRFYAQCGKLPILLIGSHAYSIENDNYNSIFDGNLTLEKEKQDHYCDYAVSPILAEIKKKDLFYILENGSSRSIVDMNRLESRGNDNDDSNDNLFRQSIRSLCDFIRRTHEKIPIIIDLHSFSKDCEWKENDIMILEQTKNKVKTNKSLMDFTYKFFIERDWEVAITDIHNQDDIVEELAYKNLGIPLLIEINEKFLTEEYSEEFSSLIENLCDYLQIIDDKNQKIMNIASSKFDEGKKIININKKSIEHMKEQLDQFSKLQNLTDLDSLYIQYLKLMINKNEYEKNGLISQNSDGLGYVDIMELHDHIESESSDELTNIKNTLYTMSNQNDSIIIPLELFTLWLNLYYGEINRKMLEEWDIETYSLINAFMDNDFKEGLGVGLPRYESPNCFKDFIYGCYLVDSRYYISYVILWGNINHISNENLAKDISYLKEWLKLTPEQIEKIEKREIDDKLISFFNNSLF